MIHNLKSTLLMGLMLTVPVLASEEESKTKKLCFSDEFQKQDLYRENQTYSENPLQISSETIGPSDYYLLNPDATISPEKGTRSSIFLKDKNCSESPTMNYWGNNEFQVTHDTFFKGDDEKTLDFIWHPLMKDFLLEKIKEAKGKFPNVGVRFERKQKLTLEILLSLLDFNPVELTIVGSTIDPNIDLTKFTQSEAFQKIKFITVNSMKGAEAFWKNKDIAPKIKNITLEDHQNDFDVFPDSFKDNQILEGAQIYPSEGADLSRFKEIFANKKLKKLTLGSGITSIKDTLIFLKNGENLENLSITLKDLKGNDPLIKEFFTVLEKTTTLKQLSLAVPSMPAEFAKGLKDVLLNNKQIQLLELTGADSKGSVNDEILKILEEGLTAQKNVQVFTVSFDKLSFKGMKYLLPLFQKNDNLKNLRLWGSQLQPESTIALCENIMSKNLMEFHLSEVALKGTGKAMGQLLKKQSNLQEFSLVGPSTLKDYLEILLGTFNKQDKLFMGFYEKLFRRPFDSKENKEEGEVDYPKDAYKIVDFLKDNQYKLGRFKGRLRFAKVQFPNTLKLDNFNIIDSSNASLDFSVERSIRGVNTATIDLSKMN